MVSDPFIKFKCFSGKAFKFDRGFKAHTGPCMADTDVEDPLFGAIDERRKNEAQAQSDP